MKYAAVIAVAVLVGLHWSSEFGWFTAGIAAVFFINILIDKHYEQKDSEDPR